MYTDSCGTVLQEPGTTGVDGRTSHVHGWGQDRPRRPADSTESYRKLKAWSSKSYGIDRGLE